MGIKIRYGFEFPSDLQDRLKQLSEKHRREFNKRLRKQFGDRAVKHIGVGNLGRFGDTSLNTITTRYAEGPSHLLNRISELYVNAWDRRYSEIRHRYLAAGGNSKKWRLYKQRNQGKEAKHNGMPIKFSTEALMTGFLRQSVRDAFRSGGNKYLDVGNLMLEGAFAFHPDRYPGKDSKSYVDRFIHFLMRRDILPESELLVDFSQSDWQLIAVTTRKIIKEGFVDPFIEWIDQQEVEIRQGG